MKKMLLAFGVMLSAAVQAQNGLEGIIVEKFYISNEADSINAADNGATYPLHVGSVTYRVYADLLPGHEFIQTFGSAAHPLTISTTTAFYNDPNFGFPIYNGTSVNNTKKNTTLIDSYLTAGGVATGLMGVLKTEDTDGSIGNLQGILANTDAAMGLPITGTGAADGLMPGTPIVPNTLGFTNELDVFDQTPGGLFTTTGGTVAALGGAMGVTSENRVLIGQFTTDGVLSFKLNLQIGTLVAGESQIFVAENPTGNEILDSTLTYTSQVDPGTFVKEVVVDHLNEFLVYPNPTNDVLTISRLNGSGGKVDVSVIDVTGRKVMVDTFYGAQHNLSVNDLAEGIYLVSLRKGNQTQTIRISKK